MLDNPFKPGALVIGLLFAAGLGYLILFQETDRQKFDRLEIGMSAAEVRNVLFPPRGGKYGRSRMDVRDDEVLHLNDVMIITMAGGNLVSKEWTGPEPAEQTHPGK